MRKQMLPAASGPSRRDFIKASSLLVAGRAASGGLNVARAAHAYGSDDQRKVTPKFLLARRRSSRENGGTGERERESGSDVQNSKLAEQRSQPMAGTILGQF